MADDNLIKQFKNIAKGYGSEGRKHIEDCWAFISATAQ